MYRETLERVMRHYTGGAFQVELDRAKEAYFRRTGTVFEDDPAYEVRMCAFLEWYLLDRLLWDFGMPPIRLYNETYKDELSSDERAILNALEKSVHSLFTFLRREDDLFRVQDFFDGTTYEVRERRSYAGVEKGDLIDARIVSLQGGRSLFSDAFWIHPRDAQSFIVTEGKQRIGKGRPWFQGYLLDLAYMRLKYDRYQHVPIEKVYDWDTLRRDQNGQERHEHQKAEAGR